MDFGGIDMGCCPECENDTYKCECDSIERKPSINNMRYGTTDSFLFPKDKKKTREYPQVILRKKPKKVI
ncbi:MAG: hypothetical protein KAI26_04180 [Nanoarchaeota archaeon]|nr:hypothetical protein [Nanoarchaeota archaeon]